MTDQAQALPWRWLAAPIVLGCAGALGYLWLNRAPEAPAAVPQQLAAPPAREAAPPPPAPGLPSLDASDPAMREALGALVGAPTFAQLFTPAAIIRTLVATVDSLPRHRIRAEPRPVAPAQGAFIATSDDQASPLSASNFPRYAAHVGVVGSLDAARVAAVYRRYQPLFEQAYHEYTHSQADFDVRLLQCIDDLLAAPTPDASTPILVHRPDALYEYVDEHLESLSVGGKLMLRIGPEQAAILKAKLRELRRELTGGAAAATSARTPG